MHRPWYRKARDSTKRDNTTENADFYNSRRWRNLSRQFRKENVLCHYILSPKYPKRKLIPAGFVKKVSEVVDHIIPIAHGGAKYDRSNLQCLTRMANDWKAKQERIKPLYKWTLNDAGDKVPMRDKEGFLIERQDEQRGYNT